MVRVNGGVVVVCGDAVTAAVVATELELIPEAVLVELFVVLVDPVEVVLVDPVEVVLVDPVEVVIVDPVEVVLVDPVEGVLVVGV